ncbi:hydrogen peroxide-dependent heme synthase [Trueperella bialowiezensis]|uniref:Coproheme decarboxylase n=1 Tax=Trueperella bialowiezensis TaxID=312285 RepID=A0A448PEL1_9ACTO|nr:hydrogen peroxide-dependent heme synthase [Trueperella bialowiezensis]VEI13381.1 putative heme peroxidase [Trueperella bialowiezensis]
MTHPHHAEHGGHPGAAISAVHGHDDPEFVEKLNRERPYVMWAVFAGGSFAADDAAQIAAEVEAGIAKTGVKVRGFYDLSGYRHDADLMAWFIADTPEKLQAAYRVIARGKLGVEPVWSVIAQHKPAEFNKAHLPGMFVHEEAPKYASVYPFVRSYDWYLIEPWKRAAIMRNHGMAGREFGDLVTSTLATFALSDYEWVVSLEGDDLTRIVDLLYAFRNTEARMYIRQDTPFFTGVKCELADWARKQAR